MNKTYWHNPRTDRLQLDVALRVCSLGAIFVFLSSCGGKSALNPLLVPPSLPGDASTAASNGYLGTQSPGLWSLTLDDTQAAFSYLPITNAPTPNNPVQGNFALENGIENFGSTSAGVSAGMAVELAGRSTILRPGDSSTAPVAMVTPSACFPVGGRVRFIYTGIQTATVNGNTNNFLAAYGTLVVSTSTDGKSWEIGDQRQFELPTLGSPSIAPGTLSPSGAPLEYAATCSQSGGQTTITADANPVFAALPSFVFNSAGYFVEDYPGSPSPQYAGYAGLAMPSAPLSSSDVLSGSYRGLVFEPGASIVPATQPIGFDPSGKTLVGGVYPGDDPTTIDAGNMTISLGSQDSALYGVYPQATLVMSDPSNNCVQVNTVTSAVKPGFDVNGIPTCTTRGVAVVGKPEGKYVIYFTSLDGTVTSAGHNAYTLQMYLYQQ
jgi:hypothetical protein